MERLMFSYQGCLIFLQRDTNRRWAAKAHYPNMNCACTVGGPCVFRTDALDQAIQAVAHYSSLNTRHDAMHQFLQELYEHGQINQHELSCLTYSFNRGIKQLRSHPCN